ncbi:MAG TPA: aldo/keto reductase [Solirubrobacteraceae bacterium]|nr:aldo/keto reductase [Solirubrobacteraceae bacterium]
MNQTAWLDPSELRIGLGCMRMSTDPDRDPELAEQTIAAALDAGITVFDTAHAYGLDEDDLGHNERLVARAMSRASPVTGPRIVTKGGMARAGGAWMPDGRAKTIRADCEASLDALGVLPIDLYLIHAPDPRVPWRTSVRALQRLLDDGLVKRIGVSNVNLRQLDEALALASVAAVQVGLSVHDDRAVRGGVLDRCNERGIAVIAHSPLGGPRRARTLARTRPLAEVALAWLLELSPNVVAIPGARRPETARSAARAARLTLAPDDLTQLERAFDVSRPMRTTKARPDSADGAEVVVIMGIPGAGKTRLAESYASRGYVRLNRDEQGGALRDLAGPLERALASGGRRVVLDNTYLTRAARSYVLDVAHRHGIPARCVWLETPLAQAQVNLVERLLDRFGALPTPADLRALARREPGVLAPAQQLRTVRELEPPSPDEGFASVEITPFTRARGSAQARAGVFVAAAAPGRAGWREALEQRAGRDAPHLVFDWRPDGTPDELALLVELVRATAAASAPIDAALCPHGGGPPRCWCRPPLPGLPLAFARTHNVDPARSIVIGTSRAHRTLATALGARYVPCG